MTLSTTHRDVLDIIFGMVAEPVLCRRGPTPSENDPEPGFMQYIWDLMASMRTCKLFYKHLRKHINECKISYIQSENSDRTQLNRSYTHGYFQYKYEIWGSPCDSLSKMRYVTIDTSFDGIKLTVSIAPISEYYQYGFLVIHHMHNSMDVKLSIIMRNEYRSGITISIIAIYRKCANSPVLPIGKNVDYSVNMPAAIPFLPYCKITDEFMSAFTLRERSMKCLIDLYRYALKCGGALPLQNPEGFAH